MLDLAGAIIRLFAILHAPEEICQVFVPFEGEVIKVDRSFDFFALRVEDLTVNPGTTDTFVPELDTAPDVLTEYTKYVYCFPLDNPERTQLVENEAQTCCPDDVATT